MAVSLSATRLSFRQKKGEKMKGKSKWQWNPPLLQVFPQRLAEISVYRLPNRGTLGTFVFLIDHSVSETVSGSFL